MAGERRRDQTQRRALARLLLLGRRRLFLARFRDYLRSSLWFLPALAFSAAAALALSTTTIDRHVQASVTLPFGLEVTAEDARGLLSLIGSWMLTFIGLAFTMTIVVLQLASAQYSPRVLGTLLRDRYSQVAMGIFIGTFAYSFMVMRTVKSGTGEQFVPAISLAVAFTMVLVSLGVFIRYVNHVAQSIKAGSLITRVAQATRRVFDELMPPPHDPVPGSSGEPYRTIPAPIGGVLVSFDEDGLVALAHKSRAVLEIVPRVGHFVPRGGALVRVFEDFGDIDDSDVLSQIRLGQERTMQQDAAFGFRQLVDIAERALSPGVNDPTTAVQVIDQLHDLLRELLRRDLPAGAHVDAEGIVRLLVPTDSWTDFLQLAVEEIRDYGAHSLQVSRRLHGMLGDLRAVAPAEYHAALDHELSLLHNGARQHFPELERQGPLQAGRRSS